MKNQVAKDALWIGIAVGIYGISFGALAVTYGFSILETTLLSSLMFTGASQFAFIGVIGTGGGALAAIAVAALLGSRNTLYALSLTNVLKVKGYKKFAAAQLTIDESTGMSVKYRDDEVKTKQAFWFTGISVFVFWNIATIIGAVGASLLEDPTAFGLDGTIAAAFLALVWPRLHNRLNKLVFIAAFLTALALTPILPPGLPILATALIAVIAGVKNA